jgi:integrase
MARKRLNTLPKYLELNPHNQTSYYRNPAMPGKANLGRDVESAVRLAGALNARHRIREQQDAARVEARLSFSGELFSTTFEAFVEKYIRDYRLKSSTARRLHQRRVRLTHCLGDLQVPVIDTQLLRESIASCSQFEQTKMKTLLERFFRYAKSTGVYPSHLVNPANDLFVDPVPHKQRQRMTVSQFRAIYREAPVWLQWLMTLGFHLALRRVDLVNLRFDDLIGDRIVSPIRKTDTQCREIEATSVDFPLHADVRRVIAQARVSSFRANRCPFIVHRIPERKTKRAHDALVDRRMEHAAQVLPEYASKAFSEARCKASRNTDLFAGLNAREMPTLHEIRALSSHLYARAGYDVAAVQDLMAHTDPDMTRSYQKGHARKVLRVEMVLPFSVAEDAPGVREPRAVYDARRARQNRFPENFLMGNRATA